MTQPHYIATAGPADPNAPLAAKFYTVMTGLLGVIGIASTFGLITAEQSASLGGVGTAAGTLVGAVTTAIAAFRTKKQVGNGTFDKAPPPPPPAPATSAVDGLKAVQSQFEELTSAVAGGVGLVQDAARTLASVTGALNNPLVDDFLGRT